MGSGCNFLSDGENNSRLYIDWLFNFFLSSEDKKSSDPEGLLNEFFSFVEKICSSRVCREIFVRLLVVRASCASSLRRDLGVSQASTYRGLDALVRLGLVVRVLPHRRGRGRPYTIYAVKGYGPEDVVRAVERAHQEGEPAYSLVLSIKQLIMEDYIRVGKAPEITWREILREARARCGGYSHLDIANLVARELRREGIQIWR